MYRIALLALLVVSQFAHAKGPQKAFELIKDDVEWSFRYRWVDDEGHTQRADFALPTSELSDDREERTWLPRKELNDHMVASIRAWSKSRRGPVKIKASANGGSVLIEVSGPRKQAKTSLRKAEQVRDQAMRDWLAANRFTELNDGLSFDHALLVNDYSGALQPVAQALMREGDNARTYTERALSFVASIPYEARKRRGGDPGYRRPLALLTRNRGDCDSKAVLFLALVRAAYPKVPLAVLYVPNHALTALGLPPDSTDRTFRHDGTTYVYAEPVGPALHPLGEPAKENRRAGVKGEVRVVPLGPTGP